MSKQLNKNCRGSDSPYIARNHVLYNQANTVGNAMASKQCSNIGLSWYGAFDKDDNQYLPGTEDTAWQLLRYANDKIARRKQWVNSDMLHQEMRRAWFNILNKIN
jgi:hypothetical protein